MILHKAIFDLASITHASEICLDDLCSADVTTRAALLQNRVEMLIGSQTKYDITNKIRILFLLDNTIQ